MTAEEIARWAGAGPSSTPARNPQPPAAVPSLPPPPPGMMWAQIGGVLACIPIQQQIPPPIQPMGSQQWGQPAYVRPSQPSIQPTPRARTCTLMKPDGKDPWADVLAGVPDLVPDQGFDAMAGRPNPVGLQEIGSLPEMRDVGAAVDPTATNPYPESGQGVPSQTAIPLK